MRGTTPTHTFCLPFDASMIKTAKIVYAQEDKEIFCKRLEDCDVDGTTIQTTLTQEETFMFDSKKLVQIQIRILAVDGSAHKSNVMKASVDKCLDDEVLI